MGKQLEALKKELDDIDSRVGPMLKRMETLDNNFWNPDTGNWSRYFAGLDMLAARLQALGAGTAADPAAAADPEVQQLLPALATAKADCKRISTEFWTTVTRVQAIAREVQALKTKTDQVVRDKSDKLLKSKSLPQLQALSRQLSTLKNDLDTACLTGPHQPNHALLN